ncbi:MAG: hypothetical protein KGL39_51215 [Patescibacteria group bacterium]|nr:hypothetical protein [Patescibacteria group bacterium]
MKQDEAEKLARRLQDIIRAIGNNTFDDDVRALCDFILSGDMKREIKNAARLEAMEAIRRGCQACEGTGYASQNVAPGQESECEYCGRPMDAIRALIQPPAQKEGGE